MDPNAGMNEQERQMVKYVWAPIYIDTRMRGEDVIFGAV
jgi:hypothetical protein